MILQVKLIYNIVDNVQALIPENPKVQYITVKIHAMTTFTSKEHSIFRIWKYMNIWYASYNISSFYASVVIYTDFPLHSDLLDANSILIHHRLTTSPCNIFRPFSIRVLFQMESHVHVFHFNFHWGFTKYCSCSRPKVYIEQNTTNTLLSKYIFVEFKQGCNTQP